MGDSSITAVLLIRLKRVGERRSTLTGRTNGELSIALALECQAHLQKPSQTCVYSKACRSDADDGQSRALLYKV
jgi:hypothetical protein